MAKTYESTFESTKVRKYFRTKVRKYESTKVRKYFRTKVLSYFRKYHTKVLSKVLSYFRTRPRAVAGRIDLKLRHDVVHRSPMPSQSSASFRGLEGGFRTSQRLSFKMVLRCPKTVFQASKTRETFDMFLKEEMKEAWAIVENASIS